MRVPPDFIRISDTVWEILPSYKEGMRVPVRIFATKKLISEMNMGFFDRVTNVFCQPPGDSAPLPRGVH